VAVPEPEEPVARPEPAVHHLEVEPTEQRREGPADGPFDLVDELRCGRRMRRNR